MFIRIDASAGKAGKIDVTKHKADGTPVGLVTLAVDSALNQRIKLLKPLGVRPDIVARIDTNSLPQELSLITRADVTDSYFVRHVLDKAVARKSFPTFAAAMAYTVKTSKSDLVIEWNGLAETCCVDIDFKEVPSSLREFVTDMKRQPAIRFGSKSGSFHLIYYATDGITALEFAALAGLELKRKYPLAKVEYLSRTRASVGKAREVSQTKEIKSVQNALMDFEVNEQDFNAWLEEHGYQIGGRYGHDRCPVAPDNSAANNPPVAVYEHSIKCHKCASDGVKYGSRDPGYFPQSALIGGKMRPNSVITMAKNFVHWDHARPDVENFNLANDDANWALYSVILKSFHGLDDPRLGMVRNPTGAKSIYRKPGYWVDENGDDVDVKSGSALIHALPFVYDVVEDGSLTLNRQRVDWCKQTGSLERYGYKAFRTVCGYQFTRFDESQSGLLLTHAEYVRDDPKLIPLYVPQARRLSRQNCEEVIKKIFPGINLAVIENHLIGIGCGEYRNGVPMFCLTIGPTGSGKSLHATIAAAFVAQLPLKATEHSESQRFFEAVAANAKHSGMFIIDEVFKPFISGENRMMVDFLQLTASSAYHKNYVGSVSIDCNPYTVGTDTGIPNQIHTNAQMARRFGVIYLHQEWDISPHLHNRGISDVSRFRQFITKDELHAVNSYVSHITDSVFDRGRPDFYGHLKRLGFGTLRETETFSDQQSLIREFVAAFLNHKNTDKSLTPRFGKDAKVTRQSPGEPLWAMFMMLQTDADRRQGETECNALSECDLATVCKRPEVPPGSKFLIKKHGRNVGFTLRKK